MNDRPLCATCANVPSGTNIEKYRKQIVYYMMKNNLPSILLSTFNKDVLDEIQEKYEQRQSMLIKPSNNMEEYVIDTSTMIPKGLEVYDLMKAMQKMYQRKMLSRPLDTHISKKDISIEQRSDQIRNYFKVRVNKRVKLDELFDSGDRYYFIVTFLSILVLANDKEVEIIQEGLFDDIYVEGKE